jgi:hypothetical protein
VTRAEELELAGLRDAMAVLARDARARGLRDLTCMYAEACRRVIHERRGWDYTPLYSNAASSPSRRQYSKGGRSV